MEFAKGNEDVVKVVSMILFGLVSGIVGMYLTDVIEILSTSFFGSFVAFRFLGNLLGGYPDAETIANSVNNPSDYVPLYLYLLGTVIMAFVGMYHQCKHHQMDKEKR